MTTPPPTSPLGPEALRAMAALVVAQDPMIPPGHNGALVAIVNLDHVQVAIATKIGDAWTASLTGRYEWTGEKKIEASIKRSW